MNIKNGRSEANAPLRPEFQMIREKDRLILSVCLSSIAEEHSRVNPFRRKFTIFQSEKTAAFFSVIIIWIYSKISRGVHECYIVF